MTGSVARWRDNREDPKWLQLQEKIPTKVAYDLEGDAAAPVAWGKCDNVPFDQIKGCFKEYINDTTFTSRPRSIPGMPTSKPELHRWIRDYLKAFCAHTASMIDRENYSWRDSQVIWNFSVPGSWAELPTIADFRRQAEDAVLCSFDKTKNVHIFCNVTEATASAQSLLVENSIAKRTAYAVGARMITCDIGGATVDVAVSEVVSACRLTSLPQLNARPVGITAIEKSFWKHVRQTLRNAGMQDPDRLAEEIARGVHFAKARKRFSKRYHQEHVLIKFPDGYNVSDWPPHGSSSLQASTTIIKDLYLIIHSDVFESFFEEFVGGVEEAIDEAINKLGKKNPPCAIGFCGGGSRTVYPLERLRRRYGGGQITIIDHEQLAILPEMATIIGSSLLWDQTKVQEFVSVIRFGLEEKNGMTWGQAEENQEPSSFDRASVWVIRFSRKTRSSFNKHNIVAFPSTSALPKTLREAQIPGSRHWVVEVDLRKEKGPPLSWTREYEIVCNIIGVQDIEFRVRSSNTGQAIPCTVEQTSVM